MKLFGITGLNGPWKADFVGNLFGKKSQNVVYVFMQLQVLLTGRSAK